MLVSLLAVTTAEGRLLILAPSELITVRGVLRVLAGALLFGAGLLHLAVWRVQRTPSQAQAGAVLAVLGLPTAFLSRMGPVLHDAVLPATLNPWPSTLVGLTTVTVAAVTARASAAGGRPVLAALVGLAVTALGFCSLLVLVRQGGLQTLDPPVPLLVTAEVGVAALWFGWAGLVLLRRGDGARPRPALDADVLAGLGVVWLMRGAAVHEPTAWGLASVVLLVLVALVVLARATAGLGDATRAEHERARAAEVALAAATEALDAYAYRQRDLTHASRNAVLALRLATSALAQHGDNLDEGTRRRLEQAVEQQVAELDALVTGRADESGKP